jgi:hypothetical protein
VELRDEFLFHEMYLPQIRGVGVFRLVIEILDRHAPMRVAFHAEAFDQSRTAVKSPNEPCGDDRRWCTWWRHQLGVYAYSNAVHPFASASPAYQLGSPFAASPAHAEANPADSREQAAQPDH